MVRMPSPARARICSRSLTHVLTVAHTCADGLHSPTPPRSLRSCVSTKGRPGPGGKKDKNAASDIQHQCAQANSYDDKSNKATRQAGIGKNKQYSVETKCTSCTKRTINELLPSMISAMPNYANTNAQLLRHVKPSHLPCPHPATWHHYCF